MSNPFSDAWRFIIGQTGDYSALGVWKYLLVILFVFLIAASVVIAVRNWREDPAQLRPQQAHLPLIQRALEEAFLDRLAVAEQDGVEPDAPPVVRDIVGNDKQCHQPSRGRAATARPILTLPAEQAVIHRGR